MKINWPDWLPLGGSKLTARVSPPARGVEDDAPRHLDKRLLLGLLGGAASVGFADKALALNTVTTLVSSIPRLQAMTIPAAGGMVFLNSSGRSGVFVWSRRNLSTAVTHDPGQGIYIAPTSDTSGASGAWVRQYSGFVSIAWFGGVGDAATANDTAMNGFGTWARNQSATTSGLTLFFPPGTYNFNGANTQGWLYGIKQLVIDGYGATWQNTYNGASNFGNQLPMGGNAAANPNLYASGPLIATTTLNAQSVTCLTPAQASAFSVGSAAIVMSLDIQYYGYPPCCDQFDFVTVTAVNASTGVISFANDFLKYIHRSDFPDGPNTVPCGKARIWLLDSAGAPWAIDHVYKGLTVNIATNNILTYQSFIGARIRLEDMTICGVSPSVCGFFSAKGCTFTMQNEPDKLVDVIDYDQCSGPGLLNVQTSSINVVKARGCTFDQFIAGNAKNTTVDNCDFLTIGDGGYLYGTARNLSIINSRVANWNQTAPFLAYCDFNANRGIDGVNISYANGVFTLLNSGGSYNINTIIGNYFVLQSNTQNVSPFSGDRAVGFVTAMADLTSPARVSITTTFPYATISAATWASWINTLNTLVGGTAGTPGTYTAVALTGGTGSGATATIVVGGGGAVTSVTLTAAQGNTTVGGGYAPGDTLSVAGGAITGLTGFSIKVASVGNIAVNRRPRVSVINSHGCDTIRLLSEVTARGFLPGEYYRFVLMNTSTAAAFSLVGELIEFDFNVIQAGSAGLTITLHNPSPAYPGFANPTSVYNIVIDAATVGKRSFTLSGLNGAVGSDTVNLNGVTKTALQPVWIANNLAITWSTTPAILPIIEMIFKLDTGIVGKVLPPQGAAGNLYIGLRGSAP